jgi:arsenite methyltransferase
MAVHSSDEIRTQVAKSYGARVRPVLQLEDQLTMVSAGACCGPDDTSCALPESAANADAASSAACCGEPNDETLSNVARLYAESDVTDLPATVTDVAFGCGNPTAIAALLPGQVVLDLGSGGGIDCFLAAKMVGDNGMVYGVDMTSEMVALARKNAAKVGATNVEFRLGEIEHLPIDANSIDVIISNCVINLAPDKGAVFGEAYRVLRPGGRLQVSDMVWTKAAAPEIKGDMESWAGCVAGAMLESEYLAAMTAAGFIDVTSIAREYPDRDGLATANVTAAKPD